MPGIIAYDDLSELKMDPQLFCWLLRFCIKPVQEDKIPAVGTKYTALLCSQVWTLHQYTRLLTGKCNVNKKRDGQN